MPTGMNQKLFIENRPISNTYAEPNPYIPDANNRTQFWGFKPHTKLLRKRIWGDNEKDVDPEEEYCKCRNPDNCQHAWSIWHQQISQVSRKMSQDYKTKNMTTATSMVELTDIDNSNNGYFKYDRRRPATTRDPPTNNNKHNDKYNELLSKTNYRYPNSGSSTPRFGGKGGHWRNVREVVNCGGSNLCFIDGLVRIYDKVNFPSLSGQLTFQNRWINLHKQQINTQNGNLNLHQRPQSADLQFNYNQRENNVYKVLATKYA